MQIDAETLIRNAISDGMREAVKNRLTSNYDNPLNKLVTAAIDQHAPAMRDLLGECIKACMGDQAFREQIAASVRSHLAKTLVSRFGGELEKQVNVLKSDPSTRARITLAIEEIVKDRSLATV